MAPAVASLKPVQEILQNDTVPECYIQRTKDNQCQSDRSDGLLPLMDSRILDFSLLSSNPDELAKLHSALASWGCLQLVNHGMTSSFLDEVREMSKQFFRLPLEEKEKYASKEGAADLEGYGNDNTIQKQQGTTFNWNDKLHLQVHPENQRKLEFWPQKPDNFGTTLHEYSTKTREILEALLKAMARSLKLEEDRFSELWQAEEDVIHARFNFYPRCPNSDLVVGLKAHGDGSAVTILLQDKEVEALRIMKDDKWFRVPIIPEALVILVGDQMEIESNGIFKSPTHKVVVNPKYDRISLAMLSLPNREKEIGPLPELINGERPQLYKRLKDYGQVYYRYMASEERQINAVKINYSSN